MRANFTANLLELHRRVPGRALCAGVLWLAKQLNILVALSVSLVFVVDLVRPRSCYSPTRAAHDDVIGMVMAIEQFQLQHKDECPRDVDELKAAGVISRIPKDPWNRHFVIECSETQVRVCSRGADEVDPEDDVCHETFPYQPTPGPEVTVGLERWRWPVDERQEGAEGRLHPHALRALDFIQADPGSRVRAEVVVAGWHRRATT